MALQGVHKGQRLYIGDIEGRAQYVTLWDGLLLLKRNLPPNYPLIGHWRGRFVVGGMFWREIPHPMVKNPLTRVLYPDTFWNVISRPIRRWLIPRFK